MSNAGLTGDLPAAAAPPAEAAARPFPKIWPSIGWIVLYFALQGACTYALLSAGVGAGGTISAQSVIGDPVVILWGIFTSAVLQLLLMWLYLRKGERARLIGLTHFGQMSASRTVGMAVVLVIAAMVFNFAYATYVIPGIDMQADMTEMLKNIPFTPINIALGIFAIVVLAPLVEELLFRGLLQNALARHMPFWAAIILSSFAFALVHGQPYAIPGLMSLSLAFGYIYHRTGSLRTNILLHMANNGLALALLALQPA